MRVRFSKIIISQFKAKINCKMKFVLYGLGYEYSRYPLCAENLAY